MHVQAERVAVSGVGGPRVGKVGKAREWVEESERDRLPPQARGGGARSGPGKGWRGAVEAGPEADGADSAVADPRPCGPAGGGRAWGRLRGRGGLGAGARVGTPKEAYGEGSAIRPPSGRSRRRTGYPRAE